MPASRVTATITLIRMIRFLFCDRAAADRVARKAPSVLPAASAVEIAVVSDSHSWFDPFLFVLFSILYYHIFPKNKIKIVVRQQSDPMIWAAKSSQQHKSVEISVFTDISTLSVIDRLCDAIYFAAAISAFKASVSLGTILFKSPTTP